MNSVIIMQRYFAKEKKGNTFLLNDKDLYHIRTVMRMEDNDKVEVVYQENLYICILKNVKNQIEIETVEEIKKAKVKLPQVILVLPILKEQKMDFVLQKATELGVSKIIPVTTSRTLVKLDKEKEEKRILRWTKICKEAAEQSKRTTIPEIENLQNFTSLQTLDGLKILCSTQEKEKTLKNLLQTKSLCDKIIIVVGPEGGLSLNEEKYLREMGFIGVSLGDRILRVETVPLYILSIVQYVFME